MSLKRPRIRHRIEYVGLVVGLALVDRLPLRAAAALAAAAADLWFLFNAARRRTAESNIRRSGCASDPRAIRRIARDSFRHFALLVIESLKAHKLIQAQNWREHVVLEIPPATEALLQAPGQGVLLVSGHLGNWEVAAQILSHLKPVVGITRPLNNPLSEALIRRRKERGRFRLTPKHDARLDRLLATLRDGEILALLVDQHAGSQGIAIDFFGHPACTHASPALLHLVTRAPICFGYCVRTRPMHFIFRAAEPIVRPPSGNRQEDVRAVLRHLNRELEAAIREYPSQYVWAHRRWRS